MIHVWLYTIISVLIISLISLIGIVTISLRLEKIRRILFFFVSFAAGALIGDVFLHLLPEISEKSGFGFNISLYVLSGIFVFFILEKFIQWRHCHIPTSNKHKHPFAFMNLIGDSVHNFIDGMIIAGSYMASIPIGLATTFAVIFHEIPQEIGDFGVLLHGGFTRAKALWFNFLSALTSILGALVVLALGARIENLTTFLIPFAAGGFLYIASSDLIPELQKECELDKSVEQLIGLVLGVLVMIALLAIR